VVQHIALDVCLYIYIYIYGWIDWEMRSKFDDDNKCALSQTYILTTPLTKNEREKKAEMSS